MAQAGRGLEVVRGRAGRLDLDRVLAGHVRPTARELIGFIHDVNPTGRELDRHEAARRYAVKTRLQSLLVQRFAAELEVTTDGGEGIVLLRHKYSGLAASHAIVADLQEDARAWVRLQLDLGVVGRAWTTTPRGLEGPQERGRARRRKGHPPKPLERPDDTDESAMVAALAEGQRARASYDYEAAREAFERARALSPQAPAPLAALIDLLVNQLGLDAEASAIAADAESVARQSPTASAALGLAAARLGRREQAEAWARNLEGAAAAEILRTLAGNAIETGDLGYAAEMLARAERCLAPDPERLLVEARLDRARAAAVAAEEARLAELLGKGDRTAAATLAHAILERHPNNATARAVLKQVSSQERRARQQALFAEARAAALAFKFKQARQALASARACGEAAPELAEVEHAIVAAEARAAQLAHEKTLRSVAAGLSDTGGPRQAAIAAYLGLGRGDRESVRRQCENADLGWLDEIPPSQPHARCQPLAAALSAGQLATKLLQEGDPDGAERALRAHRSLLGEYGFGQGLLAQLEETRRLRQQASALEALHAAAAALRAKDEGRARNLLDGIVRERLPASAREEFDRLSRATTAARQHQRRMEVVDAKMAKRQTICARQLLIERLAEAQDPEEQAALRDRLVEVDAVVRQLHVRIDHTLPQGYLASEAAESFVNFHYDREVEAMLLPGGRTAILVSAAHSRISARLIDVDSGEITRVFDWSMVEAGRSRSLGTTDGRIWIADRLFNYAEISMDDWMPCRQVNVKPDGNGAEWVERCVAIPGANAAWMQTNPCWNNPAPRLRLIDVAHGSPLDLSDDEGDVFLIPGTKPPLVAWFYSETILLVVSARGQDEAFIDIPQPGAPLAIALAPDKPGYVVLFEAKGQADPHLELLLVDDVGYQRARLRLPPAQRGSAGVATLRTARRICVCYHEQGTDRPRLAYLHVQGEGQLALDADVEIPGFVGIAQDPEANTAVAVCTSVGGTRLTRLDDMPTKFPAAYTLFRIPWLFRLVDCSPAPNRKLEATLRNEVRGYLNESDARLTDERLQALAATVGRSSEAMTTYRILRFRGINGRADRLLEYMEQRNTGSFFVRLAVVEREALAGRWIGDGLEGEAAVTGVGDHLLHVRVVALLRQGRIDEAIERLAGRAKSGPCCLDGLLTLARRLKIEQENGLETDTAIEAALATPTLDSLIRLIFAADRALADGDRDEVIRLLDRAWIRHVDEAQSMARLAEAYLTIPKDGPPLARFKASTLLVQFVESRFADTRSHQLWLCGNTFPVERLRKIALDAATWLFDIKKGSRAKTP